MVSREKASWLRVLRRYFAGITIGHFLWEFLQFPLYTLWWEGAGEHGGDVDLLAVDADAAAGGNQDIAVVEGLGDVGQAVIGS